MLPRKCTVYMLLQASVFFPWSGVRNCGNGQLLCFPPQSPQKRARSSLHLKLLSVDARPLRRNTAVDESSGCHDLFHPVFSLPSGSCIPRPAGTMEVITHHKGFNFSTSTQQEAQFGHLLEQYFSTFYSQTTTSCSVTTVGFTCHQIRSWLYFEYLLIYVTAVCWPASSLASTACVLLLFFVNNFSTI